MTKDPSNLEGYIWHDFIGTGSTCDVCGEPADSVVHAPESERASLVAAKRAKDKKRKEDNLKGGSR